MCDMRPKPDVLVNLETNEAMVNPYKGRLNYTQNPEYGRFYTDTGNLEPGVYLLCGTGSHYRYWDGQKYNHIGWPNHKYEMYWKNVPHGCFGTKRYKDKDNDKDYVLIEDRPGSQMEFTYVKKDDYPIHYAPKEIQKDTDFTGVITNRDVMGDMAKYLKDKLGEEGYKEHQEIMAKALNTSWMDTKIVEMPTIEFKSEYMNEPWSSKDE